MTIFIPLIMLAYFASVMLYLVFLVKEVQEWEGNTGSFGASVFFFVLIFGILAFIPVINTVLAMKAYRDHSKTKDK